jgi:hypothetical protein
VPPEEKRLMKKQKFPPGWNEQRVREVIAHYENQTEEEQAAEAADVRGARWSRKREASMAHRGLRSRALASVALATLAMAVALAWFMVATGGKARLTYGRYLKLRKGMTRVEVEGILGSPGSDEEPIAIPGLDDGYPVDAQRKRWDDGDRYLKVVFDSQGRLLGAEFKDGDLDNPPGLLDRVRDLLWP